MRGLTWGGEVEVPLSIIIPTYNNPEQLAQCINSLHATSSLNKTDLIVVNNGHPNSTDHLPKLPFLRVLQPRRNLGWEGGLKEGLANSTSPYVMFLNDDTYFPFSSRFWQARLLDLFKDEEVGMVGPTSNVVIGIQNMFLHIPIPLLETKYLIGFCMIVRRTALEASGGVDDTMPGGDDFDLSIRMRDKGYKLVCNRDVFVYHHGFQTGTRIHGTDWNSEAMRETTNLAIIKKHGMKKFWETITSYATAIAYLKPEDRFRLSIIPRDTDDQYVSHVKESIIKAEEKKSKLTEAVLGIEGMSAVKVKHFLNNICAVDYGKNYLEVGVWKGSTFISSVFGNHLKNAYAVDNYLEFRYAFGGDARTDFVRNKNAHINNGTNIEFFDEDCFQMDLKKIKEPIDIYFYDGNHSAESQYRAFTYFNSVLAPIFICIVDDWRLEEVKLGTMQAFQDLGYEVLYDQEINTAKETDKDNWWNGLYVAVVKKPIGNVTLKERLAA